MKPIRKAPFYAGAFRPSGYGTLGGIKINDNAEVLNDEWKKIPWTLHGTDNCGIFTYVGDIKHVPSVKYNGY